MSWRWVIAAVTTVALGLVVWAVASPWLALRDLQQAAQEGDSRALAEHVDFPALRSNVKATLAAQAAARVASSAGPLAAAGAAMAASVANPVVDALVSPKGLALLLVGGRAAFPAMTDSSGAGQGGRASLHLQYERWGLVRLHVQPPGSGTDVAVLLLGRQGWAGWRVVGLRLPGR